MCGSEINPFATEDMAGTIGLNGFWELDVSLLIS